MTNELVKTYIGKYCMVSSGSYGSNVSGRISTVEDNWIEVITKKGACLVNADFVTFITEMKAK